MRQTPDRSLVKRSVTSFDNKMIDNNLQPALVHTKISQSKETTAIKSSPTLAYTDSEFFTSYDVMTNKNGVRREDDVRDRKLEMSDSARGSLSSFDKLTDDSPTPSSSRKASDSRSGSNS